MSGAEDTRKRCLACQSEIATTAVRCKECGTFQNWRRHLQFSITVLSLLVALFSVAGLTIPILIEALSSQHAKVRVSLESLHLDVEGEPFAEAEFWVVNEGRRPGFIRVTIVEAWLSEPHVANGRMTVEETDEKFGQMRFVFGEQGVVYPSEPKFVRVTGDFWPVDVAALRAMRSRKEMTSLRVPLRCLVLTPTRQEDMKSTDQRSEVTVWSRLVFEGNRTDQE